MNSTKNQQFPSLTKALRGFPGAGLYLVGGAVRDQLLERPTADYDFIVTTVPADQLEKALAKHGTVNLVGKTFGVFKFQPPRSAGPDVVLDIALPRTEHSWGAHGGYKEFDIQSDPSLPIEKDLERRDFTVNAMARDLLTGELVDLFNGKEDLKKKVIRAVGEPGKRFDEDASRLLRALRFACELSFEIEPATWTALKERVAKLTDPILPREIVGREIVKAFIGDPARALKLFDEAGVLEVLMPELLAMKGCEQPEEFHSEGDVWVHTGIALEKLPSPDFAKYFPDGLRTPDLILSTLFHDLGKPLTKQTPAEHGTDRVRFNNHDVEGARVTRAILERLRMASSGLINADRIEWLVRHHLVLTHANVEIMKPTTIEKYFLRDHEAGQDLLKLIFVDSSASPDPKGHIHLDHLEAVQRRIKEIESRGYTKAHQPKLLVTGNDLMKKLKLEPGPEIGRLLGIIRGAQLAGTIDSKKAAIELAKESLVARD